MLTWAPARRSGSQRSLASDTRLAPAASNVILTVSSKRSGSNVPREIDKRCTTPVALRGKPWTVHPVVLVKTLQETLVDRVQVDDEEVTHGSMMVHHDEGNVLRAGRLSSRAECPVPIMMNGARPPVGLRGKRGAVHLSQVRARKARVRGTVQPEHALAWSTPTWAGSPG